MKKIILSSIALFTFTCLLNAQSIKSQAIEKKSTPQKVDKNIKKLEKKTSKAETLMEREQEEKKTEEQAKKEILDMVAEYCDTFHNKKKEFDLSLYSSQIGVDLFYRRPVQGTADFADDTEHPVAVYGVPAGEPHLVPQSDGAVCEQQMEHIRALYDCRHRDGIEYYAADIEFVMNAACRMNDCNRANDCKRTNDCNLTNDCCRANDCCRTNN